MNEFASPNESAAPEASSGKATLYRKMAAVMAAVKRVEKRGYNTNQKYAFASAEDVKDMIRRAMAEQGLALLPSVRLVDRITGGVSKGGTAYIEYHIDVDFTIACGETGESVTLSWRGESQDYQDKGVNKALTAATKYFLIATFLVSTGEEVDADAGDAPAPETANAETMAAILKLYRAQNPSVTHSDDAILDGLFDKVCGKGAPFTAANAATVALALAAKATKEAA